MDIKSIDIMSRMNKILIVDDSKPVLDLLSDLLGKEFTVKTALNGRKALSIIEGFRPDIIFLDLIMPGMDGYAICREIRAKKDYGSPKIIMLSSCAGLQERLKGYEAGVDDYLIKPFDREELLAKVRVFIRLKNVEDRLEALNNELNEQIKVRSKQLIDSEKMAAIGKYAAGIVHNLNNPLQAVMGYAELLEIEMPENKNIRSLLHSAKLMKEMIATILMTSANESSQSKVGIDFNELMKTQLEILKANQFFKHRVKVELDLQPLPPYSGVYSHFSQSIGNLLKNAIDAMYGSVEQILRISTLNENGNITVKISDTGAGIPPEDRPRIFDPFFTTKPLSSLDGKPTGTGLGLASCKEMIESYGGEIGVESQIGQGTIFTISLPTNN